MEPIVKQGEGDIVCLEIEATFSSLAIRTQIVVKEFTLSAVQGTRKFGLRDLP